MGHRPLGGAVTIHMDCSLCGRSCDALEMTDITIRKPDADRLTLKKLCPICAKGLHGWWMARLASVAEEMAS